jgi:hypothetical protein
MSRVVLLALLTLGAPSVAVAQTVVHPEVPLDSARASLRDAMLVLRDSLSSIDAAAGRLQRDNRQASAAALVSRARVMTDACARSARNVAPARQAVKVADVTSDVQAKRQHELLAGMGRLRDALAQCQSEFGAMSKAGQGEQVRGYGNDRASRIQAVVRAYEAAAGRFLAAMGIKVSPLGVEPKALAG